MVADDEAPPKPRLRASDGRSVGRPFPKGTSGYPGAHGQLKKKARALLKGHEAEWVAALVGDLTGKPGPECTAAQKLFAAYRWGKPAEQVELSGPGGGAAQVLIEIVRKVGSD